MNFLELTLLLGSDEALWCVVLPSFVICFFAIIPSTLLRLREIVNTNVDLTTKFMFRLFNLKTVRVAFSQCYFLGY